MRVPALLVVVVSLAIACRRSTPVLSRTALYKIDSIRAAIAVSGSDSNRWESYRAAADTAASWEAASGTMKSIICRAPSAGGYFQLGNILLRGGQTDEAIRSYRVAEQLGYAPISEVYCRLSQAFSTKTGAFDIPLGPVLDTALRYMEAALRSGCVRPDRFLKDSVYGALRVNRYFLAAYDGVRTPSLDGKQLRWHTFLNAFPPAKLPLSMDVAWLEQESDFAPITPGSLEYLTDWQHDFGRMMEEQFFYVARLEQTAAFTAVIFEDWVGNDVGLPDDSDHLSTGEAQLQDLVLTCREYELATFGPDGSVIDHMPVAGHMSWSEPLKLCTIGPDMYFTVTRQPYRLVGGRERYDGRPVLAASGGTQHYRIDASGRIVRVTAGPGGMPPGALTRN